MTTLAQKIAIKLNLEESGLAGSLTQNELTNDDLIDEIQNEANGCFNDVLWVFSDDSCINRQGDEYWVNDDVDMLDQEYLESVGYC